MLRTLARMKSKGERQSRACVQGHCMFGARGETDRDSAERAGGREDAAPRAEWIMMQATKGLWMTKSVDFIR